MTTAYVYDPFESNHTFPGHPENRLRMEQTWSLLNANGILDALTRLPNGSAPLDSILAVHGGNYVDRLEAGCRELAASGQGDDGFASGQEQGTRWLDQDTYINASSFEAALRAVGGLLNVTDAVMSGAADNGFAIVRPPGHHARPNHAKGFCLFGNVAAAARHAQKRHGARRLLVVDFDVHHGNGTAEIFYNDPSVLFFSIHQSPHYPFSGGIDENGRGAGEGFTVNVPFPAGVGDDGYLAALRQILAPLAHDFKPDAIFVSAGFDGHWMDPLSGHRLGIGGYISVVEELMKLADALCEGRLVFSLEGGYDLNALPHCILSALRALSGAQAAASDPFGAVPGRPQAAEQALAAVKSRLGLR